MKEKIEEKCLILLKDLTAVNALAEIVGIDSRTAGKMKGTVRDKKGSQAVVTEIRTWERNRTIGS